MKHLGAVRRGLGVQGIMNQVNKYALADKFIYKLFILRAGYDMSQEEIVELSCQTYFLSRRKEG